MRIARVAAFALTTTAAFAQFGGKPGEAVIYLLSSKGNQTFDAVPATTANTPAAAAKFEVLDPFKLKESSPGDDFPQLKIYFMHRDPDDVFQLIVQDDVTAVPHHVYLTTFKIFVTKGTRRDYGYDFEQPRDFTPGGYTTFLKFADLGPNLSMGGDLYVLGWSNNDARPPLNISPPNTPGPAVPPGKTGTELVVDFAVLPPLQPWTPARLKYPGANWPDGVDFKFLEDDPIQGNVTQQLRLKPGRKTPNARIRGNTHFYVLQGTVVLTPSGGGRPITLKPDTYVYIPNGFAFTLSNPRTSLLGGL